MARMSYERAACCWNARQDRAAGLRPSRTVGAFYHQGDPDGSDIELFGAYESLRRRAAVGHQGDATV
jgi:hypothetical protein